MPHPCGYITPLPSDLPEKNLCFTADTCVLHNVQRVSIHRTASLCRYVIPTLSQTCVLGSIGLSVSTCAWGHHSLSWLLITNRVFHYTARTFFLNEGILVIIVVVSIIILYHNLAKMLDSSWYTLPHWSTASTIKASTTLIYERHLASCLKHCWKAHCSSLAIKLLRLLTWEIRMARPEAGSDRLQYCICHSGLLSPINAFDSLTTNRRYWQSNESSTDGAPKRE